MDNANNWTPKKVVAAVDGSDTSIKAAQHAASLARLAGGSLTLVTVVRPPEGWWGIDGEPPAPEALATALTEGRHQVLDKVTAAIDTTGIELDTEGELGDPATTIAAVCHRLGADLLVIGRRGAGVVERLLIGSVADRLAHHCPCPVLIVS